MMLLHPNPATQAATMTAADITAHLKFKHLGGMQVAAALLHASKRLEAVLVSPA